MRPRLTFCLLFNLTLILFGCSDPGPVAIEKPRPPENPNAPAADGKQPNAPVANAVAPQSKKNVDPESPVPVAAIDVEIRQPATVAEAAQAIDLSAFPLIPESKSASRRVASLAYEAAGDVKSVFEYHRRALLDLKCQELSEPQIFDQSASGQYGKDGYHISVSLFPSEPGKVSVRLQNHSNVNLSKLPVPPGCKFQYAFPGIASFETTASVEETAAAVKLLLLDQGWQVYGSAGDVMTFKKNAVELNARVLAPPAQSGKTVIDYSATQLSADLPAPADAEHVQYSDDLKQLNLHALGKPNEVAAWYQKTLAPAGWQSTTENPIHDGVESFMIFRNPAKDLLNLKMWDLRAEKKVRVTLNHQSAAEVEEWERKADAFIAAKKKKDAEEKNKPQPKAAIRLPAAARDVKAGKTEIEFHLATGQGKAAVDALVQQLTAAGWKSEPPIGDNMAGHLSLEKDGHSVKILYVDPGFIPAQITITGWGVELEQNNQ
jgi:hypothetical protein